MPIVLLGPVFVALLALKLLGVVAWSWVWITSPIWIGALLWLALVLVASVIFLVTAWRAAVR